MFEKAAAPLQDAVNKNPTNFDALVKLGNLYYDSHQYPDQLLDVSDLCEYLGKKYGPWYRAIIPDMRFG